MERTPLFCAAFALALTVAGAFRNGEWQAGRDGDSPGTA